MAKPIVDIVGLIGPKGVGGVNFFGAKMWDLRLPLIAWRRKSGPIEECTLTVTRSMSKSDLDALKKRIGSHRTIRMRVRVSAKLTESNEFADFVSFDGKAADRELAASSKKNAIVIKDPALGTFKFDKAQKQFESRAPWMGQRVDLTISILGVTDFEPVLRTAREFWKAQESWQKRIQDYAIKKLLPLKNRSWLDEDEEPVTAAQFKKCMKLYAIGLYSDGSFDFWHKDGGLFDGHSIMIAGTLKRGPNEADIPG